MALELSGYSVVGKRTMLPTTDIVYHDTLKSGYPVDLPIHSKMPIMYYCIDDAAWGRRSTEQTEALFSLAIGRHSSANSIRTALVDQIYRAVPTSGEFAPEKPVHSAAALDLSGLYREAAEVGHWIRLGLVMFVIVAPAIFLLIAAGLLVAMMSFLAVSTFLATFFGVLAALFASLAIYVFVFQRKVGMSWNGISGGAAREWISRNHSFT